MTVRPRFLPKAHYIWKENSPMDNNRCRVSGHVTVFISMVMMCIFALFCVLVEE